MMTRSKNWFSAPYLLWLGLFVIIPVLLILYQSFFDVSGNFTLGNYAAYFTSGNYVAMTVNSFLYAFLITLVTFLISYPTALFLSRTKHKQLWLSLIILPTWVNLLLKAYAFIGIFSQSGSVNQFLTFFGLASPQPRAACGPVSVGACCGGRSFMILPIYNSIMEINPSLQMASYDLGATRWETLRRVIFPLSMSGVRSGFQAVFIPSLSLFMLTRMIGGNRVITLGTAVEQHFLVTQNWGMGSTIGVILIVAMIVIMFLTGEKNTKGGKR